MNRMVIYVRIPSMHKMGYVDLQGYVGEYLDDNTINVVTAEGKPLANGQTRCQTQSDFGFFFPGDRQWASGWNPIGT